VKPTNCTLIHGIPDADMHASAAAIASIVRPDPFSFESVQFRAIDDGGVKA